MLFPEDNEAQIRNIPKTTGRPDRPNVWKTPLDRETVKKVKKKHRAWRRYLETREEAKYVEYVRLRNQVRSSTRKASRWKEKEIAEHIKDNPKKFWKFVNSKMKTRGCIPDLEVIHEDSVTTVSEDQEKAQELAKFFSSVYTKEPEGPVPETGEHLTPTFDSAPIVTEDNIMKKINMKMIKTITTRKKKKKEG